MFKKRNRVYPEERLYHNTFLHTIIKYVNLFFHKKKNKKTHNNIIDINPDFLETIYE